jgi:Rrf2 family iron-sulfur cluster assembly transcriptional regulator
MLSKSCQYALRAALYLALRMRDGQKLGVRDIAAQIDAPEAFAAKILQSLVRHRVISSLKGPYGGFFLEPYQFDLPLLNVVHAIDGLSIFRECGLGLQQCSETRPCPLHYHYKAVRESLQKMFEETTIGQLALDLRAGTAFINNLT